MCFSETTFALRHRSKRTVLISDSSTAGVFPVIARSIRTAFQVRQACAALPRNSMLSKESSIQDPQFVSFWILLGSHLLPILMCCTAHPVEESAYCSVVQLSKLPAAVAASAVGKVQRNLVMLERS